MPFVIESSAGSNTLEELFQIQPPSRLFHYTTPDGLMGILRTKELWATCIDHLNDSNEIDHCVNNVRLIIENDLRRHLVNEVRILLTGFAEWAGAAARRYYVASLSEQQDELSQWRAYCPDGGYALGLSSEQLAQVGSNQGFRLVKCCYDDRLMQTIIREWITYFTKKYECEINKGLPAPKALEEIRWKFSQHIARFGSTFKHKAFEDEREWRLISSIVDDEDPRIDFRFREGVMAPYFRFALADATYPDLRRGADERARIMVRCGPKTSSGRSQVTIQKLLSRYVGGGGHGPSSIPYRVK